MGRKPKKFRFGYVVEEERYKRTAPRLTILAHYLDTSSWAGTVVTIVFWASVVALFYFLVIH